MSQNDHQASMERLASKSLEYQKWSLVVSAIGILAILIGNSAAGVIVGVLIALVVMVALVVLYSVGNQYRHWQTRITAVNAFGMLAKEYRKMAPAIVDVYRTVLKNNYGYAIAEKRPDLAEYFRQLMEELDQSQNTRP